MKVSPCLLATGDNAGSVENSRVPADAYTVQHATESTVCPGVIVEFRKNSVYRRERVQKSFPYKFFTLEGWISYSLAYSSFSGMKDTSLITIRFWMTGSAVFMWSLWRLWAQDVHHTVTVRSFFAGRRASLNSDWKLLTAHLVKRYHAERNKALKRFWSNMNFSALGITKFVLLFHFPNKSLSHLICKH